MRREVTGRSTLEAAEAVSGHDHPAQLLPHLCAGALLFFFTLIALLALLVPLVALADGGSPGVG